MGKKGVLIAVEGIDGAGKTTQAYLLVEKLRKLGVKAEYTTEPTYGRVGDILRLHVAKMKKREPIYEALLYTADRFEHVKKVIQPKIRKGIVLVSDRYLYSTLAYQGAAGLDEDWLRKINFFAPKPNLTIYIDIAPEKSLRRIAKKRRTVFERLGYARKVREFYLKLARKEGFLVFDGTKRVEVLHEEIVSAIVKRLKRLGIEARGSLVSVQQS
ncbi:MAG: dTMP kinase [Candidatus Hecatellales archaeon]|nr:MAG: dTMP kinase [Candidatus Hecatellales archaeon]